MYGYYIFVNFSFKKLDLSPKQNAFRLFQSLRFFLTKFFFHSIFRTKVKAKPIDSPVTKQMKKSFFKKIYIHLLRIIDKIWFIVPFIHIPFFDKILYIHLHTHTNHVIDFFLEAFLLNFLKFVLKTYWYEEKFIHITFFAQFVICIWESSIKI